MKLGAWLDQWLQAYTGNVKPATKGAYEEHIRVHIKPYLGEVKLAKLTAPMVQNVYNTLLEEKGLSPKSVKNIHGVLHRALEQAKKLNYLRENPLDAVILPRTEKPQLQTMDDADMIAFLQAIEGDAYEIELFVDAFTGLRQGELLGLTWDCVDFEHQTLLINKQHNRAKGEKEFHFSSLKTEKVRSLTVTDEVMDALRRQQRRQAAWKAAAGELWSNPDNLVFTTEFGRYVNNKTLYMNFKRVMRSQGLSELRFHDLRHPYVKHTTKIFSLRLMDFQAQAYPDARRKTRGACQLLRVGQSRSPVRPLCNRKRFSCLPPQSKMSWILYAISMRLSGYTSTRSISSSASSVVSVSASKIALDASLRLSCRACSSCFCFACANTTA